MAADARLTALETLVLGRAAMGETRGDRPRSPTSGASAAAAASSTPRRSAPTATSPAPPPAPPPSAGARAFATLVHAAPGAEARLDAARALLAGADGVTAAATAKPGLLILRFLAADAAALARARSSAF